MTNRFLFVCALLVLSTDALKARAMDWTGKRRIKATQTSIQTIDKLPRGGLLLSSKYGNDDEETVVSYLENIENKGSFYIQGWRWHTMSLIRDTTRLEKLAQRLQRQPPLREKEDPLKKAANYVVDFNMKGLHKIEKDVFFPWMRKRFSSVVKNKKVHDAFCSIMDEMDHDRQSISQLGLAVKEQAAIAAKLEDDEKMRTAAIARVAHLSAALSVRARGLFERQEKLLVPAVAALVSESDQKSLNSKVIRKLGILDSRLHLVGMHDAVWDLKDKSERKLFQQSIPRLPRLLIPRWKKNLYEPRAGVLDEGSQ